MGFACSRRQTETLALPAHALAVRGDPVALFRNVLTPISQGGVTSERQGHQYHAIAAGRWWRRHMTQHEAQLVPMWLGVGWVSWLSGMSWSQLRMAYSWGHESQGQPSSADWSSFHFLQFPPQYGLLWFPLSPAGCLVLKTWQESSPGRRYVWVYGGLSPGSQMEAVGPRGSGQCFEYPEHWLSQ